jgi:hypothetical protein
MIAPETAPSRSRLCWVVWFCRAATVRERLSRPPGYFAFCLPHYTSSRSGVAVGELTTCRHDGSQNQFHAGIIEEWNLV